MLDLKFDFWMLFSTLCYLALVASKVWKQNLNFPCTVQCGGIWAANKKIALSMHFCDEFFNFMIFERGSKPLCSSTLKSFTVAFSKFPKRSICVLLYLISRDVLWGKQIKLYHAVKALGSFNNYSSVPNRRAGRNKRAGGKILKKTLNVQDRIDLQGENFLENQ